MKEPSDVELAPASAGVIPKVVFERAHRAVAACFLIFGLCIGTWATHIPFAKERLGADPASFGGALLCMALGGVIAMPLIGYLNGRIGSARTVLGASVLSLLLLPLPFVATGFWVFALVLGAFGAALGALDVSMNAHGLAVEKGLGRPTMSLFHGLFSVASMLAGMVSSVLIGNIPELIRAILTTCLCLGLVIYSTTRLLPAAHDRGDENVPFALPSVRTIGVGILCMLALLIEGATIDWSGIYLRETFGANGTMISVCFAGYAAGMAISRLLGDRFRSRHSPGAIIRVSALSCAAAMIVALFASNPHVSLTAFALSGLALGPMAPMLFAMGGTVEPRNPSSGIAAVATLGYLGVVTGPPLVGNIAHATDLGTALMLISSLSVCAAIASYAIPALRPARR